MAARFAYAYVSLLLVLELLLFISSLVLHLSVIFETRWLFEEFGAALFRGTLIVGIPVIAFIKDSLRWRDQLRTCPRGVWKVALTLGGYSLVVLCFQAFFPEGASFSEQALAVSGFPLGFDAIAFCVIYSVLWSGYLTKSDVVKGAGKSLLMVFLGLAAFLAYRAGYLRHPQVTKQESWSTGEDPNSEMGEEMDACQRGVTRDFRLPPILALEWNLEAGPFGEQCSGT